MFGIFLNFSPANRALAQIGQALRTWDEQFYNGAIFANFNPVQEKPWKFDPGGEYTRRYRLFVYDGELGGEDAVSLYWNYAHEK